MNWGWDGSDLGKYPQELIRASIKDEMGRKVLLGFTPPVWVIVTGYKDNLPFVADALKPLFDLKRVGRHKIQIGKDKYVIERVRRGMPLSFISTPPEEMNITTLTEIRKCFIFRELLGLKPNNESCLLMELTSDGVSVISFRDYTLNDNDGLSKTNWEKWFAGVDITSLLETMVGCVLTHLSLAVVAESIERKIRSADPGLPILRDILVQNMRVYARESGQNEVCKSVKDDQKGQFVHDIWDMQSDGFG